MHVRSEEINPKMVVHIGKIGVNAFWSQSMRSKQKIGHVHPELTISGKITAILKFLPVAAHLTEHTLLVIGPNSTKHVILYENV